MHDWCRQVPGQLLHLKMTEQASDCEDHSVPGFGGRSAPATELKLW